MSKIKVGDIYKRYEPLVSSLNYHIEIIKILPLAEYRIKYIFPEDLKRYESTISLTELKKEFRKLTKLERVLK